MRILPGRVASFLLLCSCALYGSRAADVSVGTKLRSEILEASRALFRTGEVKRFQVIELWASEHWAFLCACVEDEQGHLQRTDEDLDIYEAILKRSDGRWRVVSEGGDLAPTKEAADCRLGQLKGVAQLSDEALEAALSELPWAATRELYPQ